MILIKKKKAISFQERNRICIFLAETSPAQPHHAVLRWTARRSRLLGSQTWGQVSKTNIFLGGTEYHAAEFWSKFKLIKFSKSIWPPAQTFDLPPRVLRHRIRRPNSGSRQHLFGGTTETTGAPKASEPCVDPAAGLRLHFCKHQGFQAGKESYWFYWAINRGA